MRDDLSGGESLRGRGEVGSDRDFEKEVPGNGRG